MTQTAAGEKKRMFCSPPSQLSEEEGTTPGTLLFNRRGESFRIGHSDGGGGRIRSRGKGKGGGERAAGERVNLSEGASSMRYPFLFRVNQRGKLG